jgi:hypothetical protein
METTLVIDNFTVLLARQTMTDVGERTMEQTGTGILGNKRAITFGLSGDPVRQGATVQIQKGLLTFSSGYRATMVLKLIYGQQFNLNCNKYKKFIIEFDGADQGLNLAITLHSQKTNTYTGFQTYQTAPGDGVSFRIEAPIADFMKGETPTSPRKTPADFDLGSVDSIAIIIQSASSVGGHDFGIKSIRLE